MSADQTTHLKPVRFIQGVDMSGPEIVPTYSETHYLLTAAGAALLANRYGLRVDEEGESIVTNSVLGIPQPQ